MDWPCFWKEKTWPSDKGTHINNVREHSRMPQLFGMSFSLQRQNKAREHLWENSEQNYRLLIHLRLQNTTWVYMRRIWRRELFCVLSPCKSNGAINRQHSCFVFEESRVRISARGHVIAPKIFFSLQRKSRKRISVQDTTAPFHIISFRLSYRHSVLHCQSCWHGHYKNIQTNGSYIKIRSF